MSCSSILCRKDYGDGLLWTPSPPDTSSSTSHPVSYTSHYYFMLRIYAFLFNIASFLAIFFIFLTIIITKSDVITTNSNPKYTTHNIRKEYHHLHRHLNSQPFIRQYPHHKRIVILAQLLTHLSIQFLVFRTRRIRITMGM